VAAAFAKPRQTEPVRPEFGGTLEMMRDSVVNGASPEDFLRSLDDFRADRPDAGERAQRIRQEIATTGFEALAWYQPHHKWSEGSWGIYFDAAKLDDFAHNIYQDIKRFRASRPHHVAAFLAFGLTLAHELFHARVEAAASWLELTALQPRYLRYNQNVYEVLRGTSGWLEEALANWSAWHWFCSDPVQQALASYLTIDERLNATIENTLDLSPPGYKDWRQGELVETWRILSTQLVRGKPSLPSQIGLPSESILRGEFPYDFQSSDVPLHFLGEGIIADRLLSHPAALNVVSYFEMVRALKHFNYACNPSGGKGSHEKWTRPDQKAFILPKRDPVSAGVFRTFLQQVGIDKSAYLREVRPGL
jgi:hypothetical protein